MEKYISIQKSQKKNVVEVGTLSLSIPHPLFVMGGGGFVISRKHYAFNCEENSNQGNYVFLIIKLS